MHVLKKVAAASVVAAAAMAVVGTGSAPAAAAETESFTVSVQNAAYHADLDEYDGNTVYARDPGFDWQNWTFSPAGSTSHGSVFTIRGGEFGKCITGVAYDQPVVLRTCDSRPEQLWIVDTGRRFTPIVNGMDPSVALQANGVDQPVTVNVNNGDPSQWWELYNK